MVAISWRPHKTWNPHITWGGIEPSPPIPGSNNTDIRWRSHRRWRSRIGWRGFYLKTNIRWRFHRRWRSKIGWRGFSLYDLSKYGKIDTLKRKIGSILNIEVESKTPYILSLLYTNEITGDPINITGYSAFLQVRRSFGSSEIFLSLSSADSSIILEGSSGIINAIFTQEMLDGSLWRRGAYDLVIKDTNLKPIKLVKGFITINI